MRCEGCRLRTHHSLYWSFHRTAHPAGTSGALGGGGPVGGAKSSMEEMTECLVRTMKMDSCGD